jgi:ABC-2 type transport system permease protein
MTAPVDRATPAGPLHPAGTGAERAAPPARRVLAQARFETLAVLRNGEQLLVTLIVPVVALIALGRASFIDIGTGGAVRIDVVTPGVLGLAVMAGSLTSQAIATAFDRRNGVLRLLATTPLGRGGLLAGKVLAVLAVATLQVLVVGGTALALGWRPAPGGIAPAVLALLLGVAAFTALALLLAGTLRAEAVLAVANLLLVVLAVVGGVVLPVTDLPSGWAAVAQWLPPGALGEALRTSLVDGAFPAAHLAALAAWALGLAWCVRRWFRWD